MKSILKSGLCCLLAIAGFFLTADRLHAAETIANTDSLINEIYAIYSSDPAEGIKIARENFESTLNSKEGEGHDPNKLAILLAALLEFDKQYDEAIPVRLLLAERLQPKKENFKPLMLNNFLMISQDYSLIKDYENAMGFADQALDLSREMNGPDSKEYDETVKSLLLTYKMGGNYHKIQELEQHRKARFEKEGDTANADYAETLVDLALANIYLSNGGYQELMERGQELYRLNNVPLIKYKYSVMPVTTALLKIKDFEGLVAIMEREAEYFKNVDGPESPDYAEALVALCNYYLRLNKLDESEKNGLEAFGIGEKLDGNELYVMGLAALYLNQLYDHKKDYAAKIDLGQRQLKKYIAELGEDSSDVADVLINLAYSYADAGQTEEMEEALMRALSITENVSGRNSKEYADNADIYINLMTLAGKAPQVKGLTAENLERKSQLIGQDSGQGNLKEKLALAKEYASQDMFDSAEKLLDEVISAAKADPAQQDLLLKAIKELSSVKYQQEEYKASLDLLQSQLQIIGDSTDLSYIIALTSIANAYLRLGDYKKALENSADALDIVNTLIATAQDEDFEKTLYDYKNMVLSSQASIYTSIGNRHKSALLQKEIWEARQASGETVPEAVWQDIENEINGAPDIMTTPEGLAEYKKMVDDYYEILEDYNLLGTKDHASYLAENLAVYYAFAKDWEKALEVINEGLKIYDDLGLGNSLEAETAVFLQSHALWETGDKAGALNSLKKSLQILSDKLSAKHPKTLERRIEVTNLQQRLGEQACVESVEDITENTRDLLVNLFSDFTAAERNLYWDKFKDWFQNDVHYIAYQYPDAGLNEEAYNAILFGKGVLLNTEMELGRVIAESGNDDLINNFYKLRVRRAELNGDIEKNPRQIRQLEDEIETLEKQIIEQSKEYGDYTANLSLKVSDIANALGTEDAAIEFVTFSDQTGTQHYVAYVLKNGAKTPDCIYLFNSEDLANIPDKNYYRTSELAKLVWQPLQPYLESVENVYFSPDGSLYNIAIEYLPDYAESGFISDRYNLYRVSSTRELTHNAQSPQLEEITLYGGLNYNAGAEILAQDLERYPEVYRRDFDLLDDGEDDEQEVIELLRNRVSNLPGTKKEVENIDSSFKKHDITPDLFMGDNGTEGSFKNLSGKKKNLIHVATHGFYATEKEAQKKNYSFLEQNSVKNPINSEEALTRSGLLFAGANNVLKGILPDDKTDDGVLTAKEISSLDFNGVDLVVLSACQTGLGEISSEGVFGLQRGFKKAGANSLLMSLWKVSDQATELLMSSFYENLLAGQSKHEALKTAINFVRDYEKVTEGVASHPYANPENWAAFILLDGIN